MYCQSEQLSLVAHEIKHKFPHFKGKIHVQPLFFIKSHFANERAFVYN